MKFKLADILTYKQINWQTSKYRNRVEGEIEYGRLFTFKWWNYLLKLSNDCHKNSRKKLKWRIWMPSRNQRNKSSPILTQFPEQLHFHTNDHPTGSTKKLYISFSGNRTLKIYLKAHSILKKLKQESIWYASKNSRFIVCQSDNSKNIFRDNSRETVFYANGIKIML